MPRGGSRPGERRGGRKKGSLNKYTIGKAWRQQFSQSLTIGRTTRTLQGYSTLDGRLELLRWAIETCVPDPEHRKALGKAVDDYIAAREKVASKEALKARKVVKPPPPPQSDLMPLQVDPNHLLIDWGPILPPQELDPEIAKLAKCRNGESVESVIKRLTAAIR
jgi:hypothetical protein